MAISKAEWAAYGAGAFAILGSFLFRKRLTAAITANARIFGVGALATGGAMTIYRRRGGNAFGMIDGVMGQTPQLGLANTERVDRHGKTLKVWDDRRMGIKERVYLLQGLVANSVKDPTMRNLALAVTGNGTRTVKVDKDEVSVTGAGCPARDDMCEAKAIFDWVAGHVRYTGDTGAHALSPGGPVEPVDEFQSAARTVEFKGGDCDDHAVLNATLAVKNGFPAKFRITSNTGDSWDHIYALVGVPKLDPTRWVALDTTLGNPGFGKTTGKFDKQPSRAKQVDFAA
jgi:hypothetical protein